MWKTKEQTHLESSIQSGKETHKGVRQTSLFRTGEESQNWNKRQKIERRKLFFFFFCAGGYAVLSCDSDYIQGPD
jgi:hypothetical protein